MNDDKKKPLSIAMMIETVRLGGAEMVVLQLSEELRRRGHAVHPIVPLGHEGWLLDRFREAGFAWHTYDLRRPIDPTLPRRLAATLSGLAIDVAHSHEFTTSVYGAFACRRINRPLVITMHGNQTMAARLRRRVALRMAFRRARATVGVSKDTRLDFERSLGLRTGALRVIPNGIPYRPGDRDRTRAALGVAPDEIVLLAVGSLVPRKGHALLIDAMARLRPRTDLPGWRVFIAGQGEEMDRLEAQIDERGLRDRVSLLGPRNDIPDLQAAADVFVMPSLWEGLPLAILEAMFAGNAIVASRSSGIPEAIDDGTHGILTTPGDVDELEAALGRVLRDPALRERLGSAALARARTEFTVAAMADAYERLYRGEPDAL